MKAELTVEGFVVATALGDDFSEYLAAARTQRREPLPGRVPATQYVADVAGEIVGWVSIRHELNSQLWSRDGHIGYAVRPGHRRRGYATEMLRQALGIVAALGEEWAVVTCADTNTASRRTIETCGGLPLVGGPQPAPNTLRFCVPTGASPYAVAGPDAVLVDGTVVAVGVERFGEPHWGVVDREPEPVEISERAAALSTTLLFDDPTLLVAARHGRLGVADGMYSTLVARREQFSLQGYDPGTLAGVGAHAVVVTADGWVGLAVRSERCGAANANKVVSAVGEMATIDDVVAGRWWPGRTIARGLAEELGLHAGDVEVRPLGLTVHANGDVLAGFVAHTIADRADVEACAAQAADAWERTALLWCPIDELASMSTGGRGWSSWGAASYASLCKQLGIVATAGAPVAIWP